MKTLLLSLFCVILLLPLSAQKVSKEKMGMYTYVQRAASDVLQGKQYYVAGIDLVKEDPIRARNMEESLDFSGYSVMDYDHPADFEVLIKEHATTFSEADKKTASESYEEKGVKKTRNVYSYSSTASYHFSIKVNDVEGNEIFRDDIRGRDPIKGGSAYRVDRAYRLYKQVQESYKQNSAPSQAARLSEYFNEHFSDITKTKSIRGLSVKAKKHNYDDFNSAWSDLFRAYSILSVKDDHDDESLAKLESAINTFHEVVKEANPEDKKARVNADVAAAAHYNLGLCYFLDYRFSDAHRHFEQAMTYNKNIIFELRGLMEESLFQAERGQ